MRAVLASATVALGLVASPLLAGGLAAPAVEPVPVAPPAYSGLWDGFYAGGQLGYVWQETDNDPTDTDDDGAFGGFHAGWQNSVNRFVYGVEGEYNWADIDLGGSELNHVARIKAKAGYDLGRTLIYATLGGAHADYDTTDGDWGYTGGLGVDYMLTDKVSLGAEANYDQFDDFDDSDTDITGTSVTAKVSYHF